jgi:hypothetical protein
MKMEALTTEPEEPEDQGSPDQPEYCSSGCAPRRATKRKRLTSIVGDDLHPLGQVKDFAPTCEDQSAPTP